MIEQNKCYEKYPLQIVFVVNLVSFLIYIIGCYLIYQIGAIWTAVYILYILWLEIRLIKGSCPNCYYYGKTCAFGMGKISKLFFKKAKKKMKIQLITWKDILPDFLVSIIPALVGIALLIIKFDFIILLLIIILIILTSAGNGFVRGSLACKYCKQRKLGCPAEKLFEKANKKKMNGFGIAKNAKSFKRENDDHKFVILSNKNSLKESFGILKLKKSTAKILKEINKEAWND